MKELIDKLQNVHGLSTEQSHSILNTITSFIKEKFPMVGGAVDSLFKSDNSATATSAATAAAATNTASPVQDGGDFLDKISDFIPGGAGEKIEEFAKDKLGGMFGQDKRV